MGGRFDICSFCDDPQLIARLVRAEDVFGLLSREVGLPVQCAALVWGTSGGTTCVQEGGAITAEDAREILFVRTATFPLQVEIGSLRSSDGFECSARFDLSASVIPEKSELMAFAKTMVGSDTTVRVARLVAMCEQVLRPAARAVVSRYPAGELMASLTITVPGEPSGQDAWTDMGREISRAILPVGFECGLAFAKEMQTTISSPDFKESQRIAVIADLERRRLDARESLRKAEAEARREHLSSLAEVLEKVQAMATPTGGVRVAELIKTFNATQRGELYQVLLTRHVPVRPTRSIVIVAGDELLWFDPRNMQEPESGLKLEASAGLLRSVRREESDGRQALLVGARQGVHIIDETNRSSETYLCEATGPLRGGFNSAVILDGHLYATHSELGLRRWALGRRDHAELCLEHITANKPSVRHLRRDGAGRLWLAVNCAIVGWKPDGSFRSVSENPSEVRSLITTENGVYAGLANGAILQAPLSNKPFDFTPLPADGGSAIESLAHCAHGGIDRLLIADGSTGLSLLVIDDTYATKYRSEHPIRWGFASEDLIVGVNDRRDRLVVWRIDSPMSPSHVVNVGRLCGELIQDLAIISSGPHRSSEQTGPG